MSNKACLLLYALMAFVVLVSSQEDEQPGRLLTYTEEEFPACLRENSRFNPLSPFITQADHAVYTLTCDGLICERGQGSATNYVDNLADYYAEGDGAELVLRRGLRWYSHQEITADDICFTYRYLGKYLDSLSTLEVKIRDPRTVFFYFRDKNTVPSRTKFIYPLLNPRIFQDGELAINSRLDKYTKRYQIGYGRYRISKWSYNKTAEFTRVDSHPRHVAQREKTTVPYFRYIKTIHLKTFLGFRIARCTAFIKKRIQLLRSVLPRELQEIRNNMAPQDYNIIHIMPYSFTTIFFNMRSGRNNHLQHQEIRRALNYAVDKERMLGRLCEGAGTIISAPLPAKSPCYNTEVKPYPYSPDTASKILRDFRQKFWDTPLFKDKMVLIIRERGGQEEMQGDIVEVLIDNMKKLGIELSVDYLDAEKYRERLEKGDFDLAYVNVTVGRYPGLYTWFSRSGRYNYGGYYNEKIESLTKEVRHEISSGKIIPIGKRAHRILHDDPPAIFLWTRRHSIAVSGALYIPGLDQTKNEHTIDGSFDVFREIHRWYYK